MPRRPGRPWERQRSLRDSWPRILGQSGRGFVLFRGRKIAPKRILLGCFLFVDPGWDKVDAQEYLATYLSMEKV